MPRPALALLVTFLLAASCAAAEEATAPAAIEGPFVWGSVPNVTRLGDLWFSGQPDSAALAVAEEKSVDLVVNLREPAEMSWDEAAAVRDLGLGYVSVPVSRLRPYSSQAFERVTAVVDANPGKQIWIHCGNSNRVGSWLTARLVQREGMSVEEALAVGRKAGLNQEPFLQMTRDYLANSESP